MAIDLRDENRQKTFNKLTDYKRVIKFPFCRILRENFKRKFNSSFNCKNNIVIY